MRKGAPYLVVSGGLVAVIGAAILVQGNRPTPLRTQSDFGEVTQQNPLSRNAVLRRYLRREPMIAVGGASNEYRGALLSSPLTRRRELRPMNESPIDPATLASAGLFVVGTPESHPTVNAVLDSLPITFDSLGFEVDGRRFDDPRDVLQIAYRNPYDPAYPMILVTGHDNRAILDHLPKAQLGWDYEVRRGDRRLFFGDFDQEWEFIPEAQTDLVEATRILHRDPELTISLVELRDTELDRASPDRNFFGGGGPHTPTVVDAKAEVGSTMTASNQGIDAEDALRHVLADVERAKEFFGNFATGGSMVDIHLYPTAELKALATESSLPVHLGPGGSELHVTLEDGLEGHRRGGFARLLALRSLGEPALGILDQGLGVFLSDRWGGEGFRYWTAKLHAAGLTPSIDQLLSVEGATALRPLVKEILSGAVTEFLVEQLSRDTFLMGYASWVPSSSELAELSAPWQSYLSDVSQEFRGAISANRRSAPRLSGFQKGVNFTQEGFGITNGYLSADAVESLERFRTLGGNSVAVIPYTFVRDPDEPPTLSIPYGPRSESDEAVIHTVVAAKRMGLAVLLKPQIWVSGGWPGDISFRSEDDWNAFFDEYQNWITHYALMAEINGAAAFSLGVELTAATKGHEDRWRQMATSIRQIFSGDLVYSANWGEEFERITFWEWFDYIGVDNYYPLTSDREPSDRELRRGAERVVQRIRGVRENFGMPVIMTETGYASGSAPWREPHASNRVRQSDPEAQARAYDALLGAIDGEEWIHGVYWWKWPSYLGYGRPEDRDFQPVGKPAEDVLRKWYQRRP